MASTVSLGVPAAVAQQAAALGHRIRAARIRRKLRQVDLALRAGVSRTAIEAVEAGRLTTGLGTYLAALWAMGLEAGLELVADPGLDRDGIALQIDAQAKRVRPSPGALDNDF